MGVDECFQMLGEKENMNISKYWVIIIQYLMYTTEKLMIVIYVYVL